MPDAAMIPQTRPSMIPTGSTGMAMTPPVNEGMQNTGRQWAYLGIQALEKALGMLGSTSEEGQTVSKSLASLGARFGKPPKEMGRAALKMAGSLVEPTPQQAPEQVKAFQQTMRPPGAGGA